MKNNLFATQLTDEYKGSWCAMCQTGTLPEGSVYLKGHLAGSGSPPWMFFCPECLPKVIEKLSSFVQK